MVYFSKLKLYGFKSFVDKTELEIGPGLNGIVGPNGCGKSNLVEALRWVMGEKSAKNMRGAGMEDVIFAGTSKRPARHLAEVTVVMNNEDGSAPSPFNSSTEIEINRRIEKDKGSQYRVNGKAVRARDVNLLFADTMTGANSPALVSQGHITEIIVAKPSDRRRILEESAGISGLHSRRHEAELRLRAAEQNLARLNDSLNDIRSRMSSLKRQARQAERYKELSDSIRRLELALFWRQWSETHSKIKQDRTHFANYNNTVQSALHETQILTGKIENLEKNLPEYRKKTMLSQAELQNSKISLERLEQDIQVRKKNFEDALEVKTQLINDNDFTNEQYIRISSNLTIAKKERESALEAGAKLPNVINKAEIEFSNKQIEYENLISEKNKIETSIAVAKEAQNALDKQAITFKQSLEKLSNNISILNEETKNTSEKIASLYSSPELTINLKKLESEITKLGDTVEKNNITYQSLQSELNLHKNDRDELSASVTILKGEINGLQSILSNSDKQNNIPVGNASLFNQIKVKDGYEKAASSALGQWIILAGTDDKACVFWSSTTVNVNNPSGTVPLIDHVDAPISLHPFLNSVGYADILPEKNNLLAGQMIVTKNGSFMRWDGLIVNSVGMKEIDQASILLEHKNKISALKIKLEAQQNELNIKIETILKAEEHLNTFKIELEQKRDLKLDCESKLRDTRYAQERLNDQIQSLQEKLEEQKTRLKQNYDEHVLSTEQYNYIQKELLKSDTDTVAKLQQNITAISKKITLIAQELESSRVLLNDAQHEKLSLSQKTESLSVQIEHYEIEKTKLEKHLEELKSRIESVETKILSYAVPEDNNVGSKRNYLLENITKFETDLVELQTYLDTQENEYRKLQEKLREAESNAAKAREERATSQANVANSESDLKRLENEIREKFELSPQALEEQVFTFFDNNPQLADLQNEKDIITRQRDNIGPVNLRAAIECTETETHLANMENEYSDLTKAIEQLRGGIAKLNKEAKERLSIAFKRVDLHFQRLFSQLFDGGKAYLEMILTEDPLESGLEIYAQPPGKSLQKLSLLSGGEQTLTATALIFAMFLTNPSPICVLDEIDAPLDDANVDRVCSLMETIVNDTDTRFIVITHHRMTMARMNRLYGVTMSERGVSQLVSVDLALQEELPLSESA